MPCTPQKVWRLVQQRQRELTVSHHKVRISVNGSISENEVEARLLLVHYLRDVRGLTGTHVGCDTSNCGACTVLLDGRSVKSCSVLTVSADGSEVLTVEGLAADGELPRCNGGSRNATGSSAATAPPAWSWPPPGCCWTSRTRTSGPSVRGSRATSAGAPATP